MCTKEKALKTLQCGDPRIGSIVISLIRTLIWIIILIADMYIMVTLLSPNLKGEVHAWTRREISAHGYLLYLILFLALGGIGLEIAMLVGVLQRRIPHLIAWMVLTVFCGVMSLVLVLNYLIGYFDGFSRTTIAPGNFFLEALCVFIHILFYFIPQAMLSPMYENYTYFLLAVVHLLLPLFHFHCFYVVFVFYRSINQECQEPEDHRMANAPVAEQHRHLVVEKELNGGRCSSKTPTKSPVVPMTDEEELFICTNCHSEVYYKTSTV